MTLPLVTLIVAVYNVEQYIKRCIDSLVAQTYKNIEILIINDGTKDNSVNICKEYQDSRIRIINKENGGLSSARNKGIEEAKGQYLLFIDGDDYVEPNMVELLMKHQGYDIVFSGYMYDDHGKVVNYKFENLEWDEYRTVWNNMLGSLPTENGGPRYKLSVWANLFSTEFIKNNVRFKSERDFVSEDLMLYTDLLRFAPKIAYSNECSYHYMNNDYSSLTKTFKMDRFEKETNLYKYILQHCKNEEEKLRISRSYLERIDSLIRNRILTKSKTWKKEVAVYLKSDMVNFAITQFDNLKSNIKFKLRLYYLKKQRFTLMYLIHRIR